MKYFNGIKSPEEAKKRYRKLAVENHPDRGGDVEVMKIINSEYDSLIKSFDGFKGESGFTYNYDSESENEFKDILNSIIDLNCDIEIIGSWIWVFNSYGVKDILKSKGFWFSKSKKAWVYNGDKKSKRKSRNSVDDLREKWGSEKVKTYQKKYLA